MRKIISVLVLIILFFSSASTSYVYFSGKNSSLSKITSETNNSKDFIPKNTDLKKSTTEGSIGFERSQAVNNIQNPVTDEPQADKQDKASLPKSVKDRALFSKEVFLTFDDGPSINTLKILKILKDNNVKATFFVIGKNVDEYPYLVKAEYMDGMTILNHTYSHEYSMYKNIETCISDFNKCKDSIKNAISMDPLPYIRFPGGSDNTVSDFKMMKTIRKAFVDKGMEYVDWNVDSGDADSIRVAADIIDDNLIKQLTNKSYAVTLMHDAPAKTTTVEALPGIIRYLKKQDFVFRTFEDLTPTEEKEMIREGIMNRGIGK